MLDVFHVFEFLQNNPDIAVPVYRDMVQYTAHILVDNGIQFRKSEDLKGAVDGYVKIDIGGGNIISSNISMASIKELSIQAGGTTYVVINARFVMVGVEDEILVRTLSF